MPWIPKATAPAYFSLADAFIALITGDPIWGWLVDWATLIPNTGQNTAAFCAAGPPVAAPLDSALFNQTPGPTALGQSGHIAGLIVSLTNSAADRVYGAYCQDAQGASGVFGPDTCADFAAVGDTFPTNHLTMMLPPGTTRVRGKILTHTGSYGLQLRYYAGMTSIDGPFTGLQPLLYGTQADRVDGDFNVLAVSGGGIYTSIHLDGTATVCVAFDPDPGGSVHTPTAQPQPPGVLSPLRTVPPTLEGIAAEAERLELKLDMLIPWIQSIAGATLDLGGAATTPEPIAADAPLAVGDAVGAVIRVSSIPPSLSLDFGTPQSLIKMGHVNCGTADAWYPSIWLSHNPLVLRPFPPGTTRLTVTDLPPGVTATVSLIQRNK